MEFIITAVSLLFLFANVVEVHAGNFDVTKYGAKDGANADISQALMSAWKEACQSTSPSTVVVPKGTYLLNEVIIEGPCRAPIGIRVEGTLKAPADPSQFKGDGWLTLNHIDQFTLDGAGTFDGQGATAWARNDCGNNPQCHKSPMNLRFNFITNAVVRDVTSLDSKNFHVNVLGCKNLSFQHFTVTAAETSINTDGIHIGRSDGINITDTNIKTGDDCVSIGDGSRNINIQRVNCGPGHGISVGSLGRYPNEEPVVGITVRNCTLTNTMNGVRVKTWPASPAPGTASEMHFEDIIMTNVGNPILIDQEYCPYNQCTLKVPSLVKISNVSFKNIRGTSSSQLVVKLVCSKSTPCQNVEVGDIDLTYSGPGGPATTLCSNIKPTFTGKQNPPACVNSAQSS
ncbi:Exopolygalacturonase [Actinidia chinensis var. chinensis]|uniref:Exopolygalacturonase n=1 Tax=Actinidia chinensis var. chinensis TaxID=1590841 RepID=A0A2R6QCX1_ACTCC|nr:Exopolygalacturonase [Actinidia chinensis var. chinensis]